jgi:hypothetical protein
VAAALRIATFWNVELDYSAVKIGGGNSPAADGGFHIPSSGVRISLAIQSLLVQSGVGPVGGAFDAGACGLSSDPSFKCIFILSLNPLFGRFWADTWHPQAEYNCSPRARRLFGNSRKRR